MSKSPKLTTTEKALEINLQPMSYGSFAEIGAGQEVARCFFRAGKASATIAKTLSAYDMAYSDYLYGAEKFNRYVCEGRLRKMLKREYKVLTERTARRNPDETRFFAFCDTVASQKLALGGGHGWMGIRFQDKPNAEPSHVIIHVRLLDKDVLTQQEAVGIMGVNLVHGAIMHHQNPEMILRSLNDNLRKHHFEVDMVEFDGPAFADVDNRLMSLRLVQLGLTNAVIFSPDGQTHQPTDMLFGKDLLVQRGRFRPLTKLHLEMLEAGKKQFLKNDDVEESNLVTFFEITINHLLCEGELDVQDFLARVDLIGQMGQNVMISNYGEYYKLSDFFSKHTKRRVGMIMGVGHLDYIFNPEYYKDVPGGMMSALGLLFNKNVSGLIFPAYSLDVSQPCPDKAEERKLITTNEFEPDKKFADLYRYMLANQSIVDIQDFAQEILSINSESVLDCIQGDADGWEEAVPDRIVETIKAKKLFKHAG